MVFISIKNERKDETSDSKQYLLRVVYDSHDKNVHKLLEGIFGPDQMLDVKNGKIAKINSTLTPKERERFLNMIFEALNKMESDDENEEEYDEEEETEFEDYKEKSREENRNNQEEFFEDELIEKRKNNDDSRKVSAEKLIEEFASFLNSIS